MKIELVKLKHYPQVADVHLFSFAEELKEIGVEYKKNIKSIEHRFHVNWKTSIKKGTMFAYVAVEGDMVLGFIAEIDGEIAIYVRPDYRRQKIGTKLLKKIKPKSVWVLDGNKAARTFYVKNGYRQKKDKMRVKVFGFKTDKLLYQRKPGKASLSKVNNEADKS